MNSTSYVVAGGAVRRGAPATRFIRRALAGVTGGQRLHIVGTFVLLLMLAGCVRGDYVTGPGWEHDRLVGTWRRVDQVHDAWYGSARLETTWQFRSNGRVYYSEVLTDYGGRWLEEVQAYGRWHGDRHSDRITIDYHDPASWGRERLRYEVYDHTLYLDGLRYERW